MSRAGLRSLVLGLVVCVTNAAAIEREPPSPVRLTGATGNAAVEKWLQVLAGRWEWSDGCQSGELELHPAARGTALIGAGAGFAMGSESTWLICWDAASRRLTTTVAGSTGERYFMTQAVSGSELSGTFTGTSESSDGLRPVRGAATCRLASPDAFAVVWKDLFIADQAQIDRRFTFRRKQ